MRSPAPIPPREEVLKSSVDRSMLMLAPNRQVVLVANSFGEGIVPLVLAHMSRTCRSLSDNRVVPPGKRGQIYDAASRVVQQAWAEFTMTEVWSVAVL